MTKRTYTLLRSGFLYGRFLSTGDTIDLTDREAKYPLMNGAIALPPQGARTEAEPEAPPAKPAKRKVKKTVAAKSGK